MVTLGSDANGGREARDESSRPAGQRNRMDANEPTSEDVLSLLRKQATLYARLESFAGRQRTLVVAEDTGSLLSILSDRQKLSVELGRLAGAFEPIRRRWSDVRARLSPPQQAEAEGLLSDIKLRLRNVIDADEEDARLLSARKQCAANDLRSLQSTQRALHAYGTKANATSSVALDEAT